MIYESFSRNKSGFFGVYVRNDTVFISVQTTWWLQSLRYFLFVGNVQNYLCLKISVKVQLRWPVTWFPDLIKNLTLSFYTMRCVNLSFYSAKKRLFPRNIWVTKSFFFIPKLIHFPLYFPNLICHISMFSVHMHTKYQS